MVEGATSGLVGRATRVEGLGDEWVGPGSETIFIGCGGGGQGEIKYDGTGLIEGVKPQDVGRKAAEGKLSFFPHFRVINGVDVFLFEIPHDLLVGPLVGRVSWVQGGKQGGADCSAEEWQDRGELNGVSSARGKAYLEVTGFGRLLDGVPGGKGGGDSGEEFFACGWGNGPVVLLCCSVPSH